MSQSFRVTAKMFILRWPASSSTSDSWSSDLAAFLQGRSPANYGLGMLLFATKMVSVVSVQPMWLWSRWIGWSQAWPMGSHIGLVPVRSFYSRGWTFLVHATRDWWFVRCSESKHPSGIASRSLWCALVKCGEGGTLCGKCLGGWLVLGISLFPWLASGR